MQLYKKSLLWALMDELSISEEGSRSKFTTLSLFQVLRADEKRLNVDLSGLFAHNNSANDLAPSKYGHTRRIWVIFSTTDIVHNLHKGEVEGLNLDFNKFVR